jgi:stage II sporulation protein D
MLSAYVLDKVQKDVSIGIILNVSSFTVGSSQSFFVSDAEDRKLSFPKGNVSVSCSANGVYIDNKHALSLPIKIESSIGIICVDFKPYKGYLILRKSGSKINVINVLNIEDYIKGVLAKEVGANWEIEALKAQAVISRTYTIANLHKHSDQEFDMCSTTHCQVYGGFESEAYSTNQAIKETQGEVLVYNGKFAQTVFHANCGGHTDDPKHIWHWKNTPSYLKGVKCGYCCNSPNTKWEQEIDKEFISKKLANNKIGQIKNIKIKGRTSSGSAKELEIMHSKGKVRLNAYQFRITVDAWRIKSHTFDYIKTKGNKIYFKGKGWGHKVGLCQCGAKGMAERGKTYKNILLHFYPGTTIETVCYT